MMHQEDDMLYSLILSLKTSIVLDGRDCYLVQIVVVFWLGNAEDVRSIEMWEVANWSWNEIVNYY